MHIEDSIISNNAVFGVIVQNRTYNVTINRTSIFDNGSIGVYFYECKDCRIENSTLYRNKGGLFVTTVHPNPDSTYSINVINSTLVDNGTMGNINLTLANPSTPLLLTNSVLANHNTAPNCASSSVIHPIVSTNSLIDDLSCSISGSGNLTQIDALLGPLSFSGGLTPTLSPLVGSPLVDAGDNTTCLAADQRGLSRPVDKLGSGAFCDIGSIEVQ